jgi:hypothetical protein
MPMIHSRSRSRSHSHDHDDDSFISHFKRIRGRACCSFSYRRRASRMRTSRYLAMRVLLLCSLLCDSKAFLGIGTITTKKSTSSMNSGDSDQGESCSSRRELLSRVGSLSIISIIAQGDPAYAAAPITVAETGNLGALTQRALRSKPPRVLRKKLNIDFAVLLMQSSYNALDQLDCVAMDQFQRDFFLLVSDHVSCPGMFVIDN